MRRYSSIRLRRTLFILLLPAALLLIARLLWGLEANRRLDQLRGELRAANIPYTPDAWGGRPVPDDQNAIIPLLHALAACTVTDEEIQALFAGVPGADYRGSDSPTLAPVVKVDALLARLAPAFADLESAAARPSVAWPRELLSDSEEVAEANHLSNADKLVDCLYALADRARDRHDGVAVYHAVLDIFTLATLLDSRHTYDAHLAAIHVRIGAAAAAERLTLDLPLTADTLPLARALLGALTDPAFNGALLRSIEAHIAFLPNAIHEGQFDYSSWPLQPLATTELVRASRYQLRVLHAATASISYPDIHRDLPYPAMGDGPLDYITHVASLHNSMSPVLFEFHDRALTDSRATALLLAAEMFLHDHNRYPTSAEAATLLPPGASIDPFSPDHHFLSYRLDPAGPTVWSVSKNGTDEGGPIPTIRHGHIFRWDQPDATYGAAWRAAHLIPPSTTPSSPPIPSSTSPDPAAPPPPPTP